MGASQNQGVIFNQTNETIYFTIHSQDLMPFEQTTTSKIDGKINGGLT
jgi:hypothetical protein